MTNIGVTAMPMDPQWDWRFPLRREFPLETYHFTRLKYLEFLQNKSGSWRVMIAEYQPDIHQKPVPIAFAIWDVTNVKKLHMRLMPHLSQGLSMDLHCEYILVCRLTALT
jgi:hypothetical protein